jgi:hypothetical protein
MYSYSFMLQFVCLLIETDNMMIWWSNKMIVVLIKVFIVFGVWWRNLKYVIDIVSIITW